MERVKIMNVPFLKIDQEGFVDLMTKRAQQKEKTFVITANPEIVMQANENPELMKYIEKATYVSADGIGVVKAAKILGSELPGRVTGYDTLMALLKQGKPYKMFLIGAQQETLTKTIENIERDYPHIEIVGSENGYFDWNNNDIADRVKATEPDFVFLALGVPRQEKWIYENIEKFNHGIFIGVGGSFDVIAGTVKRAPVFWQKLNLEWLYRLLSQPTRWKRMLALPRFAMKVFAMKRKGQVIK